MSKTKQAQQGDSSSPNAAREPAAILPSIVTGPTAPPEPAPFVYLDHASVYGCTDGVVRVTVEAVRHLAVDGAKVHDSVVVGHLRMSLAGSRSLRTALEAAELMAAPPVGSSH